jgi:hypothetical protein
MNRATAPGIAIVVDEGDKEVLVRLLAAQPNGLVCIEKFCRLRFFGGAELLRRVVQTLLTLSPSPGLSPARALADRQERRHWPLISRNLVKNHFTTDGREKSVILSAIHCNVCLP